MGRGRWTGGDTKHPVRNTRAYRQAVEVVRDRVRLYGEKCHFWRRTKYDDCPGVINLGLNGRTHPMAFTAHHLDKLMDGADNACDPQRMRAAHRRCNSRDGLIAQNNRRMGIGPSATTAILDEAAMPVDPAHAQPTAVDYTAYIHSGTHGDEVELGEWQRAVITHSTDLGITSRHWPQPT